MVAEGAGPQRSAFLSAFFTLVGCHGVHVTLGLLWLLTMMAQVLRRDTATIYCAEFCVSRSSGTHWTSSGWLIFTVVYLMGVAA